MGHSSSDAMDDLSPVSALRLNFDRLPNETTDEPISIKNVFGVPIPQFVPQGVISWLDKTNISGNTMLSNYSNGKSTAIFSNVLSLNCNRNHDPSNTVTRKVCAFQFLNLMVFSMDIFLPFFG